MLKFGRHLYLVLLCSFIANVSAWAESVDWHGPAGSRIKQIHYLKKPAASQEMTAAAPAAAVSNVIDSPPVDGFVPWIVVVATGQRQDEMDWIAITEDHVRGAFPAGINTRTDFMTAIFDTGASTHVLGNENAVTAGLFNLTYVTTNTTIVTGVTGAVGAWVSLPLALYMDGLDALEPNSVSDPEAVLPSTAGMMGQSNVSVLVGNTPDTFPDLATAIGSPMSVYYVTHILNSAPVSVLRNGETYTAPTIQFYSLEDETAPQYANKVPLELRPLGAVNVQYMIDLLDMLFIPSTPSVLMGNSSQSLFFVHSVDMREGVNAALDKSRFMLDTGAQITVVGTRIAARLGLNPAYKEFEVEIEGVDGRSINAPGFYIDSLTIPAIGEWLQYTNVPVVLLDVFSPEGGTLDGIIGMNLFTEYDLVLRGGGIFLQDDPMLEFERIAAPLTGDIAPETRDNRVDLLDYATFSSAWMSNTSSPAWNIDADLAVPADGSVNLPDMMVIAENWLAGVF